LKIYFRLKEEGEQSNCAVARCIGCQRSPY